jgi:MinD-like ATPase involved in chromosome partitioning or flagellar assembly
MVRAGEAARVVMVCGVEGGEGASTVARNLTHVLAEEIGRPVCFVRLGEAETGVLLPPDPGVGGDDRAGDGGEVIVATLTRRDLAAAIDAGFANSLRRMTQYAEFFVVDGPPLLASIDAARLSGDVDGVVLVVEADRTALTDVDAARDLLDAQGGLLLGAVLNKRRRRLPAFLLRLLGGWMRPRRRAEAPKRKATPGAAVDETGR